MRRRRATAGVTLVELLVAVALTLVVVGVVAATTTQIQRTIGATNLREDVAQNARAALTSIELDLERMVPCVLAPEPFPAAIRPLSLEAVPAGGPPRPALVGDRLRVLTTVPDPKSNGPLVRAVVQYDVDAPRPQRGGGPDLAQLRRQIVTYAGPGAGATSEGPKPSVIASRVLSFRLEWLDESASYVDPTQATATGDEFVHEGKVALGNPDFFTVRPLDPGAHRLLELLPVGAELKLGLSKKSPASTYLIRRKEGDGSVVLNDRIEKQFVDPSNPDVQSPARVSGFLGPRTVRVTIAFSFGTGPNAETARFSRAMQVPR